MCWIIHGVWQNKEKPLQGKKVCFLPFYYCVFSIENHLLVIFIWTPIVIKVVHLYFRRTIETNFVQNREQHNFLPIKSALIHCYWLSFTLVLPLTWENDSQIWSPFANKCNRACYRISKMLCIPAHIPHICACEIQGTSWINNENCGAIPVPSSSFFPRLPFVWRNLLLPATV